MFWSIRKACCSGIVTAADVQDATLSRCDESLFGLFP